MTFIDTTQLEKIRSGRGFFAALDQSGGSTPKALADYGIPEDSYSSDDEMFDLVHAMRSRVVTNSSFDGSRVLAAILSSKRWSGTCAAFRRHSTCGMKSRLSRS